MELKSLLVSVTMLGLLAGCQVNNSQEITDSVNQSFAEQANYQQTTLIDQQDPNSHGQAQKTNQITVNDDKMTEAKIIVKQNDQDHQYLEMKQENDGTTYIRENNDEWLQSAHSNQEIDRVTLLSSQQVQQLFNVIAQEGTWQQYPQSTQIEFAGENDDLLHLLNSVASQQISPGAQHQISIRLNPSSINQPINTIIWEINGTGRTKGQAVKTRVEIQYTDSLE
ncbi:hypothetical protein [Aerococcus kribbianus]|uniref:Lipoprotein n=1 Tax=Aerococcus kribbianus TaxID=2999064 RepID=A0A9X3FPB1_9LACT|nr:MULTISPECIES: hypothetical protein [unclassified Aerococcus]MCZ0717970.1 hypothetical protein [Aerococcus sp. YH-aer221]MCZ0726257.1 hypothetical protein [Aerococcus sp. YH-aer222]